MSYDPSVHHRRSIRIKGYDYTQNGAYFITVCTYRHRPLFGKIKQGEMICNPFGDIVVDEWLKTGLLRSFVLIDEWVVMPNHFHGILFLDTQQPRADKEHTGRVGEQFGKPTVGSLPTIVRSFKAIVTRRINELRGTNGAVLWQENYYERVIRQEEEYQNIVAYIRNNPVKWEEDELYIR